MRRIAPLVVVPLLKWPMKAKLLLKTTAFALCLVLVCSSSALAVSYSSSVALDLNSLTYSGIGFTFSSFRQLSMAEIIEPGGKSCTTSMPSGCLIDGNTFQQEWTDVVSTVSNPSFGSAFSSANSSELLANVLLTGPGSAQASMFRGSNFTANETGFLTASIDYSIQESGLVTSDFSSFRSAELFLAGPGFGAPVNFVNPSDLLERKFSDTLTHEFQDSRNGTLIASLFFNQGDTGVFGMSANHLVSVPGPDTLGAFLIGAIPLWLFYRRSLAFRVRKEAEGLDRSQPEQRSCVV